MRLIEKVEDSTVICTDFVVGDPAFLVVILPFVVVWSSPLTNTLLGPSVSF